jgi:hypothetical protein
MTLNITSALLPELLFSILRDKNEYTMIGKENKFLNATHDKLATEMGDDDHLTIS